MFAHKLRDSLPSNLLLALHDHAHVHRQPSAASRKQRFQGLHMHPHLSLVVHRAARVEVAIALRRLEGRRLPLVQRLRRLHVVVPIQQHRRRGPPVHRGRGMKIVCIHQRMSLAFRNHLRRPGAGRKHRLRRRCLDQPHVLHPGPPQLRRHKLRRAPHVRRPLRIGRDRRNPQQRLQLLDEPLPILLGKTHRRIRCLHLHLHLHLHRPFKPALH